MFKRSFDPELATFINQKINQSATYTHDELIQILIGHIARLLLTGGKRIRPYVAYLAYTTIAKRAKKSIDQALIAIELFHLFCLVHDDIMDNGSLRHRVETIHILTERKLKEASRRGDLGHIGQAQAILIGDLLHGWAIEAFASCDSPYKEKALTIFHTMTEEVIIGQMIDIDLTSRTQASMPLIEEKMRLKTAYYSFVRPMQIGATLTGNSQHLDFFESFGRALGLGFQIQDDLLDLQTAESSDKTSGSDNSQHTYLTQFIVNKGTVSQKKALVKYLKERSPSKVRQVLQEAGAVAYAKQAAQNYFDEARHLLNLASFPKNSKQEWNNLINLIENRSH